MNFMHHHKVKSAFVLVAVIVATLFAGGATRASADNPNFELLTHLRQPFVCLDADSGTQYNVRTNVQVYTCRDINTPLSSYQVWRKISIPGRPAEEFKIYNQKIDKCLTYNPYGGLDSPVWAERCDRPGQGWTTMEWLADDGWYTTQFVAVETNVMCLEALAGYSGQGIALWNCYSDILNIRWYVVKMP